jgi:hypothetical protein
MAAQTHLACWFCTGSPRSGEQPGVDEVLRSELQAVQGELRAAQLEASSLLGQLDRSRGDGVRARRAADRQAAAVEAAEEQLAELEAAGHLTAAGR